MPIFGIRYLIVSNIYVKDLVFKNAINAINAINRIKYDIEEFVFS